MKLFSSQMLVTDPRLQLRVINKIIRIMYNAYNLQIKQEFTGRF